MNGETDTDGSGQNSMRNLISNSYDGDSLLHVPQKSKLKWKKDLQQKFLKAIDHLGLRKAVPKTILEFMNEEGLTRTHIASHLQKFRKHLKRIQEKAREAEMSSGETNSNFASSSYINPQNSYNITSLNQDNLFHSQLSHGLGHSSLMMKSNDSINYMQNHKPFYDLSHTRSNLLPMRGSLRFSSGVLPLNEERRSVFGTSQVSQVPWLGQYGAPRDVLGLNSNLGTGHMRSNYDLVGRGGARVNGNGNGCFGENLGAMNWNLTNNNMLNHGNSNSRFLCTLPSNEDQLLSNLIAQMDGGVPRNIFETSQASQVPLFGQCGTTNDVLGMNSNLSTGYMHGNYIGINTNEYGDLVGPGGASVNGNVWNLNDNNRVNHGSSNSRCPSTWSSFLDNEDQSRYNSIAQTDGGVLRSILGTSQASQVPLFEQYGTTNDVLGMNSDLSTEYMYSNYTGINANENGDMVGLSGARVVGNGNGSLGESLGTMNWSFNNNNIMSNHGSSTSRFSSPFSPYLANYEDQSQCNLNAQTDGMAPVLENISMFDENHAINEIVDKIMCDEDYAINEIFGNTVKSQFDQNQHDQGQVSDENLELSNDDILERNAISNQSFDNHQGQVSGENLELSNDNFLNMSSDNVMDNSTEETWNAIAADTEMYCPTPDMNTVNQEQGDGDLTELPSLFYEDWDDGDFMNYLLDNDML